MRYTTVIDISEIPEVYRNTQARILYLHLALRSGYHDDDRDQVVTSIRRCALETGMSTSACRHAIRQLERAQLLSRNGGTWKVKKWVQEAAVTPRAKTKRAMEEQIQRLERQRQEAQLEAARREKETVNPDDPRSVEIRERMAKRFGLKK